MRLDKFISNNSDFSRSDIKKLVKSNRILVNGGVAEDPSLKIKPSKDIVFVDDEQIEDLGKVYIMIHKPKGYVCATQDAEHPTVIDLIHDENNFLGTHKRWKKLPIADLQLVGRLDKNTTGLLFITNDGDWNHRISSPGGNCTKTYFTTLKNPIEKNAIQKFAEGMMLEGEKKRTLPAILDVLSKKKARVTIREGKYHQVKRMFAATGNKVKNLHREKIGPVSLDDKLEEAQYRLLSEDELKRLNTILLGGK